MRQAAKLWSGPRSSHQQRPESQACRVATCAARLAAVPDEDQEREFDQAVVEAVDSLPDDLRSFMSNVAIVIEPEPPAGQPLLGLYQGVPLTRRNSGYAGALPDKITIYQGPLERHYGETPDTLRQAIRRVVLHEIAHHFGISDQRLHELDRY